MLTHSLNTVPLPLANDKGGLNKTNKASLMRHIEGSTEPSPILESIPKHSILIIDGMALIQALNAKMVSQMTFGEPADHILHKVISMATDFYSDAVHLVTDNYTLVSIKNAERGRRSSDGFQQIKIYGDDQRIPHQWQTFLACGANKEALVEFLFGNWSECKPEKFHGVTLY